MPQSNVVKNAEVGQVDLTATATVYEVCRLRGGESVTIKALVANSGQAYIGFDKLLTTSNGFELEYGDSVSIELKKEFGAKNEVVIYACTNNAGDDVCFLKAMAVWP